jgi:pentatricopeptide repeat domain-containing protein 1
MDQFGIKPDIVTYSHQLNASSSLGHMAKCMKIFDKMVEAGIEPDPQVYSILAKGYIRAQRPDKAEELLMQMSQIGVRPNVVTFTTVISGWCSVANMDNAMRVYGKMRGSGVLPNIRTFETLIWGYSELKQPWKAEEVLHMMQGTGVKPKQTTYSLIADAWKAVRMIKNSSRESGSSNGRHAINKSDQSVDYDCLQRSGDDELQSVGRSSGQATDSRSRSTFLQVTNASGSSAIAFGRILKVRGFPSKTAQSVKSTSLPRRSFQFQLRRYSSFCRKQQQKHDLLHSKSINSFQAVSLY